MLYSINKIPASLKKLNLDRMICYAADYLGFNDDLQFEFKLRKLGEGKCGYVDYEEDEDTYEIVLNSSLSEQEFIRTLFHELVHVKQMVNEEYNPEESTWFGVVYTCDYENLPWEKEAYVLEEEMYNGYHFTR